MIVLDIVVISMYNKTQEEEQVDTAVFRAFKCRIDKIERLNCQVISPTCPSVWSLCLRKEQKK